MAQQQGDMVAPGAPAALPDARVEFSSWNDKHGTGRAGGRKRAFHSTVQMLFIAVLSVDTCKSCLDNGTACCLEGVTVRCIATNALTSCKGVYESHDLLYNATTTCMSGDGATLVADFAACTANERVNFCAWCGSTKTCLYKGHETANSSQCPVPINDLFDCSNLFTSANCLAQAPSCTWQEGFGCYQPIPTKTATDPVNLSCASPLVFNTTSGKCECNSTTNTHYNAFYKECFTCDPTLVKTAATPVLGTFGNEVCDCNTGTGTKIYQIENSPQCAKCGDAQTLNGTKCTCAADQYVLGAGCGTCAKDQTLKADKSGCICAKGDAKPDGTCKGLSKGAIAGIVVGSVVGAIAIAFVCLYFFLIRPKGGFSSVFAKKAPKPVVSSTPTTAPQLIMRDSNIVSPKQ